MKNIIYLLMAGLVVLGCQKMERPSLGDYPIDTNAPDGPLSFYVAFDGTTDNPLRNAVDSIRANFASDNPLTPVDGINGKGVKGEAMKFVKYQKPNDWAVKAKDFSLSFWYKKDGQTKNNTGTNGPEYPISFKSSNGHWSGCNFLLMLEGNNDACAIKMVVVDKSMADNWLTWEGDNSITGLVNNQWRHMVLVYQASTSSLTLYLDGVANPLKRTWGSHGDINLDDSKISEVRIGGGPGDNLDSDDWLSSTWKGELDQFRLYSSALTQEEISELYTNKK